MDLMAAFRIFVRVAETGSFSIAARQLRLGQPAVSKQISALEDHLGARLLHRTTRNLTLTDEGGEFLAHARQAISAAEFAIEQAQRIKSTASGTIRLSCHSNFARLQVVPRLAAILEANPDLDIDLFLEDSWPNLVENGIDLRIHIGEIEDDSVVAQLIGKSPVRLLASPAYLEKNGLPRHPEDLAAHRILHLAGPSRQRRWQFVKDGKQVSLDLKGRVTINSNDALWEAVIQGVGLTFGPQWMIGEASAMNGALVAVMPDYDMGDVALQVAYPSRQFVPHKVRIFIDYLKEGYKQYASAASAFAAPGKEA